MSIELELLKIMKLFHILPLILICITSSVFSQKIHKVKSGEHLNMIAKKYGTTAKVLQKYNGISNANLLKVGQTLRIPLAGSTEENIKEPSRPEFHTVKKGDTFYGICNKYGLDAKSVQKANPKLNPSKIAIGQKISIPGGKPTTKEDAPPAKAPTKDEVVKQDTAPPAVTTKPSYTKVVITEQISISELAKNYNMTTAQINDANGWNYDGQTIFDVGSEAYVFRP